MRNNFITKIISNSQSIIGMHQNSIKPQSLLALDTLEDFTGWQNKELQEGNNIFKKLKNNLNVYERKYHFFHNQTKQALQKMAASDNRSKDNKQNYEKSAFQETPTSHHLPTIKTASHEKTLKNLQAIVFYEFIKNQPAHPLKEVKNHMFCEISTKRLNHRDSEMLNKSCLKKNRPANLSRVLKYRNRKAETKLYDYQFSDDRLMRNKDIGTEGLRSYNNLQNE